MQSPMFVFAGLQNKKSDDDLLILFERLNNIFLEQQLQVSFTRKDKLLISRFKNVSFYVSLFNVEREVKDWFQMAKDFELSAMPNPVSRNDFEKRFEEKKLHFPELYKDADYLVGETIFKEMSKLDLSKIYFFL